MKQPSALAERLTPREWEVLALVREGLTNDQIASKLGISRDGVKYHVSEILGKLGVEDRIEAARWYDRETRHRTGAFGLFGALFRTRETSTAQVLAGGAIVVGVVAFVALLAGVLVMQSREGGPAEMLPEDRLSGDARLDELMTTLVFGDSATILGTTDAAVAREYDAATSEETVYDRDAWSATLASATSRDVYAVLRGDPQAGPTRDFDVTLRVVDSEGTVRSWQVAVDDYRVVDVVINSEDDFTWVAAALAYQFERFVVLPPLADRPVPPASHDLAVTTGDSIFDPVLAALAGGNPAALLALVDYEQQPCGTDTTPLCGSRPEGTPVEAIGFTDCGRNPRFESRAFIERRLGTIAQEAIGIAGIARVPEGYFPAGYTMIIIVGQQSPYSWQTNALVVSGGSVTGAIDRCPVEMLYPPVEFVVLPPPQDAGPDFARRSGIDVIDRFLDALAARDIEALAVLVSYTPIGCVVEQRGIGALPLCEAGEGDGTIVEALPLAHCEGNYERERETIGRVLPQLSETQWALYAVLDLGDAPSVQDDFRRGRYQVVLHNPANPEWQQAIALGFDDAGMTIVWYGCGPQLPAGLYWPGRAPEWVLPPP